jgi:hypothetical protein
MKMVKFVELFPGYKHLARHFGFYVLKFIYGIFSYKKAYLFYL